MIEITDVLEKGVTSFFTLLSRFCPEDGGSLIL
jgi:hypothetical protein